MAKGKPVFMLLASFLWLTGAAEGYADESRRGAVSAFMQEPYDTTSALLKMLGMLFLLGMMGFYLVRHKSRFTQGNQGDKPAISKVIEKKTVNYGLVMTIVDVESQRYMILQDKHGHTVTPLSPFDMNNRANAAKEIKP